MNTSIKSSTMSWKIAVMHLWKVAGALHNPKVILRSGFFSSIVGIKSSLMLLGVTAALIYVNVAQSKLVLLENFNENYSKCLRLLVEVTTAYTKVLLLEEVTTTRGSYYC
ncbi:hypothetical protein Tco_1532504 [Tanacetum coccineum]